MAEDWVSKKDIQVRYLNSSHGHSNRRRGSSEHRHGRSLQLAVTHIDTGHLHQAVTVGKIPFWRQAIIIRPERLP